MSLTLDIHIIQSFPFSNLNRDDTGSPKDCVFGGSRRARISSQCVKRAIRLHPAFGKRVQAAQGDIGKRTKRLKEQLVAVLKNSGILEADTLAEQAVKELGLGFDKKNPELTEYLLYLGTREIEELAQAIATREVQQALKDSASAGSGADSQGKKKGKGRQKGADQSSIDMATALKDIIGPARLKHGGYAADIALFGRMMADNKDMNVSASCQVAHAISTHAVETTFDYFTAVDDFNTDDSGAGMLGIQEFNSACYYRYSNVSVLDLFHNLGDEKEVAVSTVLGFAEASVRSIPTGKQNGTAAQTPPAYGRLLLRTDGCPWSLAGAFSAPVRVDGAGPESFEQRSIARLEAHLQSLYRVYGKEGVVFDDAFDTNRADSPTLADLLRHLEDELRRRLGAA